MTSCRGFGVNETNMAASSKTTLPFQFEPEYGEGDSQNDDISLEDDESEEEETEGGKVRGDPSSWCLCGRCELMETASMCVCCKDLGSVSHLVGDIECVTCHQSFKNVCLNRDVLWTALVSLHDRESSHLPSHDHILNE
ncbi:uncharacterized protein LOC110234130 [Exaiptasia diaphana]|uniref:P2X purinoreceptor 7 intracellular domain-containing protein n=1 Tax=Exaiptasia diaphana TaxID=2652724 RepID=A0A913YG38_EXADI|nr:uncharacterized protein LOC110234130 [Exaiptasia diaphana]